MAGKMNLNLNFSWRDFIKHTLRIVISVGLIIAFNMYFPDKWIPKDFMIKTAVYMCIYVLVSLIIEVCFAEKEKKTDNRKQYGKKMR